MRTVWFVGNMYGLWELTSQIHLQLLADLAADHILQVQLEDKILQNKILLFLSRHITVLLF